MSVKQVLVLGGGFAGLWSAVVRARKLDELGVGADAVRVTLVNRDAFHSIRVRNYEADLTSVRVPLDDVLRPIGVLRVEGQVAEIDLAGQAVAMAIGSRVETLRYDRLVLALGSGLVRPNIPGLAEFGFDVDTYESAARLNAHIQSLPGRPESSGRLTVVVAGAGLTGIEAAAEMPGKLRTAIEQSELRGSFRVILADRQPKIGSDMGDAARPFIEEAFNPWASSCGPGSNWSRSPRTVSGSDRERRYPPRRSSGVPACGPIRSRTPFPLSKTDSGESLSMNSCESRESQTSSPPEMSLGP